MGIAHLADRAPFELSGGEKKRAAIASVLSLRPEVVLLDEPTASLDPRTKCVLVDLIQRLSAAGRTLIVATHELDIVPLIADRAVVLNEQGRVVADGAPAAISRTEIFWSEPTSFTSTFTGTARRPIRTRTKSQMGTTVTRISARAAWLRN